MIFSFFLSLFFKILVSLFSLRLRCMKYSLTLQQFNSAYTKCFEHKASKKIPRERIPFVDSTFNIYLFHFHKYVFDAVFHTTFGFW